MDARKVSFKIFIESPKDVDVEPMVPVFHDWIQKNALGELLIDVTEYGHVHQGPSLLLVGSDSDYAIDFAEGRAGLVYSRKRRPPADAKECIEDGFRRALFAAKKLEGETSLPVPIRFGGEELVFRVNDRLLAPNTKETFAAVAPLLKAALAKAYGDTPLTLTQVGNGRELFTVVVSAKGAPSVTELSRRVS